MKDALRRITFGVLGTAKIAAMAVGTTTVAASAGVRYRGTPSRPHPVVAAGRAWVLLRIARRPHGSRMDRVFRASWGVH